MVKGPRGTDRLLQNNHGRGVQPRESSQQHHSRSAQSQVHTGLTGGPLTKLLPNLCAVHLKLI